jgi:hypothetical protein
MGPETPRNLGSWIQVVAQKAKRFGKQTLYELCFRVIEQHALDLDSFVIREFLNGSACAIPCLPVLNEGPVIEQCLTWLDGPHREAVAKYLAYNGRYPNHIRSKLLDVLLTDDPLVTKHLYELFCDIQPKDERWIRYLAERSPIKGIYLNVCAKRYGIDWVWARIPHPVKTMHAMLLEESIPSEYIRLFYEDPNISEQAKCEYFCAVLPILFSRPYTRRNIASTLWDSVHRLYTNQVPMTYPCTSLWIYLIQHVDLNIEPPKNRLHEPKVWNLTSHDPVGYALIHAKRHVKVVRELLRYGYSERSATHVLEAVRVDPFKRRVYMEIPFYKSVNVPSEVRAYIRWIQVMSYCLHTKKLYQELWRRLFTSYLSSS